MVRALRSESHAEGHFSVWPDFTLEGLDREDLVLEKHFIFLDGLLDAGVLAVESDQGSLLLPLGLGHEFRLIVRVIRIKAAIIVIVVFVHLS
jgi:hypothetical protein